jgi:multiple sugar transport system substrate-binding protein
MRTPSLRALCSALPAALLLGATSAASAKTLTVWEYFTGQGPQELKQLAQIFHKKYPDVGVNFVYIPYTQMTNKVVAAASIKTGPDVVLYNGPTIGSLVGAGALANLSSDWAAFSARNQFPKYVVHRVGGKIYGVQGYVNLLGLWYNKTILSKLGISAPPTDIAQLNADMAKAVAAGYQGITLSGKSNDQGEWQAYPWLSAYGWSYAKPTVASCQDAYALVRSWVNHRYLTAEASTWGQTAPFQTFLGGKVLFAENGNWQIGPAQKSAQFRYGVVPMPRGPHPAKLYLGGEVESVGAFAKHPHLAWDFLKTTLFSKAGELVALKVVGSIPSRADASRNKSVLSTPLIAPFAREVQTSGQLYPPEIPGFSSNAVERAQLAMGQQWSAVIAGLSTPASACKAAVSKVRSILGGH